MALVCQLTQVVRLKQGRAAPRMRAFLHLSNRKILLDHAFAGLHLGNTVAIPRSGPYDGLVSSERPIPTRRTFPRHLVMVLGLLLAISGCSSSNSVRNPFDGSPSSSNRSEEPIGVEVQNLNFNDATVWAIRQGQRVRLGTVTGKTDGTFSIDWNVTLPISIRADILGGRSCTTGQITVDNGTRVLVVIPTVMSGGRPCRIGRR